jgi:hypothetical protein
MEPMGRHDRLFKPLLRAFWAEFLTLILPEVASELDASRTEFLDKESFTDLFAGQRRELDLVARMPATSGADRLILVHVEVEGRYRSSMARRLWRYYLQLQLRHQLPVLPVVIFLRGGPAGLSAGEHREEVLGIEVARFRYVSMGLARAEAAEWLERKEALAAALASLMGSSSLSRAEQKILCLRKVCTAQIDEARRFLLVNTVETYLELEGEQLQYYESLLDREAPEMRASEMTWAEKKQAEGMAKGREMGLLQGRHRASLEIVSRLLEQRFGPLRPQILRRLEGIEDPDVLSDLAPKILEAKSLEELGLG